MSVYPQTLDSLRQRPRTWLITGAAGFIGSHLAEALLKLGQRVTGMDNFATGDPVNLNEVRARVGEAAWKNFLFVEGSVTDLEACRSICGGTNYVLHEAGFISVPQSIEDPIYCNAVNVDGTLNMLVAAREAEVQRFVYASSSAVYGDDEMLPKVEDKIGKPLSPYGTSKLMNELYADVFYKNHRLPAIGLRYFNVFGPRQNPAGGYAAVIPKWITSLVAGERCHINGDGSNTRDFCHIDNIVQANILAATTPNEKAFAEVYNVGLGTRTSLNELYTAIRSKFSDEKIRALEPEYGSPRSGDILHSTADISKIRRDLGFEPLVSVDDGLTETVEWYSSRR